METEVIKLLISSYFSLSKRTLIDMVPKGDSKAVVQRVGAVPADAPSVQTAIMLNLVFHAKDDLQKELLGELYKPDVMGEHLDVARKFTCPCH